MVIGLAESCSSDDVTVMRSYVDAVRRGGHTPLVLPATNEVAEVTRQLGMIDLLLLLGGGDMASSCFGCAPLPTDGIANPLRDSYELVLFQQACEQHKPVVGICRGMQVINVALGGDLYQDLPTQVPQSTINHSRPDSKWAPVHEISIEPQSRLSQVLEVCSASVNSTHHQAVRRLGKGLTAVAHSDDGVIESIEHLSLPVAGVQFHPERLAWGEDVVFTRLFTRIMEFACKK